MKYVRKSSYIKVANIREVNTFGSITLGNGSRTERSSYLVSRDGSKRFFVFVVDEPKSVYLITSGNSSEGFYKYFNLGSLGLNQNPSMSDLKSYLSKGKENSSLSTLSATANHVLNRIFGNQGSWETYLTGSSPKIRIIAALAITHGEGIFSKSNAKTFNSVSEIRPTISRGSGSSNLHAQKTREMDDSDAQSEVPNLMKLSLGEAIARSLGPVQVRGLTSPPKAKFLAYTNPKGKLYHYSQEMKGLLSAAGIKFEDYTQIFKPDELENVRYMRLMIMESGEFSKLKNVKPGDNRAYNGKMNERIAYVKEHPRKLDLTVPTPKGTVKAKIIFMGMR